jgi:DNA-binding transcriptional LysR family regulator
MSLGKIEKIQIFMAVAEDSAFASAARKLNLSPSVVTRVVAELEAELGVQLFVRTTRKVALTAAGAKFAEKAAKVITQLKDAEDFIRAEQNSLSGELRVNAPLSFGIHYLATAVSRFRALYADVSLKLSLTDTFIDIVSADYDMALRISGAPKDKSTIWRKICPVPRVLVASPNYLERRGRPEDPRQLADHNCLGYSNLASGVEWTFTSSTKTKQTVSPAFCFECGNGEVLADLASLGEGITLLPHFIVEKHLTEGKLKTILVDWQSPEIWLTAYYPPYDVLPAKVKAFTSFIEDSIDTSMKAM